MNKIRKFLNSVLFRRILVIFVVGFVSRCIINYVYDVNVFKEYTNVVSIMYYGFMTYFIYDLPKISLNVFDFKLIKSVIRVFCENYYFSGKLDTKMFTSNIDLNDSKDLSKDCLISKHKHYRR